jgi:arylsulfatase A-like enzyme
MAMDLAIESFKQMRQKVTLINLPEFDWPLGHIDGASRAGATVRTLMSGFDRDLGRLQDAYRDAGVLDRTVFVIAADHGTAPIDRKVDSKLISGAVKSAGTGIIRDTYHTGAYLWLQDESRAADAAARIAGMLHPDIQAVYFRAIGSNGPIYLRASGPALFRAPGMEEANQHLLRTLNGPTGPDLVVFFREGAVATTDAQRSWKGDHGGASWESQHMPLAIAGPGVRQGISSSYPARIIDIAPTVLSLMGIPPTGMRGVPLADALISPGRSADSAQQEAEKTLRPIVASLKLESRIERTETR